MGYIVNSVGLRTGVNRGWKFKSHFIKGGSTSLFFLQREVVEFFDVFFDDRTFHKRGILFSHAVFRPTSSLGLDVDVFIYDPALERRFRKYTTRLLKSKRILRRKFPEIWGSFIKTRRPCVFIFAEFIRKCFIELRTKFYSVITSIISAKFRRAYPGLNFRFRIFPLKARMVNAEFLGRFFLMKFLYRRELVQIINPIVKRLTRRFSGMRVDCAGRFTRRQRASFTRISRGQVPLNSLSSRVDYTQVSLPLKFGVCSIKLWLGNRLPVRRYVSEAEADVLGGLDVFNVPIQRQFSRDFFISRGFRKVGLRVKLSSPISAIRSAVRVGKLSTFKINMVRRWGLGFRPGAFLARRARLLDAWLRKFPVERNKTELLKRFLYMSSARPFRKYKYVPTTKAEAERAVDNKILKVVNRSKKFPYFTGRQLLKRILREEALPTMAKKRKLGARRLAKLKKRLLRSDVVLKNGKINQ